MIPLFDIAAQFVNIINPDIDATLKVSTGYTTAADGKRTPSFTTVTGLKINQQGQMNSPELAQVEKLNIQGVKDVVYIKYPVDGVVRASSKGGDILTYNGKNWLVVHILEDWPDFTKAVVTLQAS